MMPGELKMCMQYAINGEDDGNQDGHGGMTLFLDVGSTFRGGEGVEK